MSLPTLLVRGNLTGAAKTEAPDAVPVLHITSWLKRRMPEFGGPPPNSMADRVLIVRSETGSGKSTALPVYVFRLLRHEQTPMRKRFAGPGVLCTQPRVLTAQTLAYDLSDSAHYPDMKIGVTVGYQTGPANEMPPQGLIYATAGVLLAQLRSQSDSEIMARYRFIIVDEAHERSADIDTVLMRLKSMLARNLGNPNLPFVLLASATLPTAKYAKYFGVGAANVIEVTGRQYPVQTFYPEVGTNDYPAEAARRAAALHVANPDDPPTQADILIFMPGVGEIKTVVAALERANRPHRANDSGILPYLVLALSRDDVLTRSADFRRLQADPAHLRVPSADGKTLLRVQRRIIVATVVAETGLTLSALKYVIDAGWNRAVEVYYPDGRGLITKPAAKSRIEQRKGRAGRKFPGEFHPLYTKNVHAALDETQLPEIVTSGGASVFLDIVQTTAAADADGVYRVSDLDLLDPPPCDALAASLDTAVRFGYLRADIPGRGHRLTLLGDIAARFGRLSMEQSQTLFAGFMWGAALPDLAFIVTLFSQRAVGLYRLGGRDAALAAAAPRHMEGRGAALRVRASVADDFVEALLAFEAFTSGVVAAGGSQRVLAKWCDANGLDLAGCIAAASARDAVMVEMAAAGINPLWGDTLRIGSATDAESFRVSVVALKRCILAGLQASVLEYDPAARMYRTRSGREVAVPFGLAAPGGADQKEAAAPPQSIVTNWVRLRPGRKSKKERHDPLVYRLQTGLVSVLDGFAGDDSGLHLPRAPALSPREDAPPGNPAAYARILQAC